jgi:hypothetical protein
MRILHTSDWHLGQNFYSKSRAAEHDAFLTWLLARAQEQLVRAGETGAASMMMSEVTLEIRAALTPGAGELGVEPVSLARLSAGLPQDGLSTLKLRFVATAPPAEAAARPPQRSAEAVAAEFRARAEIARLDKLLGPIQVRADYLAPQRRWLVSATDARGRLLRETLVDDTGAA